MDTNPVETNSVDDHDIEKNQTTGDTTFTTTNRIPTPIKIAWEPPKVFVKGPDYIHHRNYMNMGALVRGQTYTDLFFIDPYEPSAKVVSIMPHRTRILDTGVQMEIPCGSVVHMYPIQGVGDLILTNNIL